MSAPTTTFESGHADLIHDAQFDYYGRRLATCSSDKTVKIFDVVGEQHVHLADLRGHEGPVWQVAWAHPKFGTLLASCSFDHRVIVWKETQDNQWQQVKNRNACVFWPDRLFVVKICFSAGIHYAFDAAHCFD